MAKTPLFHTRTPPRPAQPLERLPVRQELLLAQIVASMMEQGQHPPTHRALAVAMGVASTNLTPYLRRLANKGLLERQVGPGNRGKYRPTWSAKGSWAEP